ncbi:MAG: hypothetical protein JSU63_00895 [Phycisphaerales bacterium]|nr:MAG: hypothetical protein JSU63_00895 [Phycisphaerales bacterium]
MERPISAGYWTTIGYVSTEAYYREYGYLPADSSGDGPSNTADILKLIDCCLNETCTPEFGIYSCDIDHSGTYTSADTSRLIDLLNGSGKYTTWNLEYLSDNETCPDGGELLSEPPRQPEESVLNQWFADWFVDYLTMVEIPDNAARAEFQEIAEALTGWALDHFSIDERETLADRLTDPALTFADPLAEKAAPKIAAKLIK